MLQAQINDSSGKIQFLSAWKQLSLLNVHFDWTSVLLVLVVLDVLVVLVVLVVPVVLFVLVALFVLVVLA